MREREERVPKEWYKATERAVPRPYKLVMSISQLWPRHAADAVVERES